MSEMIERVARAMCAASHTDPDALMFIGTPYMVPGGYVPCGEPRPAWAYHAPAARAAIEAMREPTSEMVRAASETPGMRAVNARLLFEAGRNPRDHYEPFPGDGSPLHQAHRAMIDQALKDTTP